MKNWGQFWGQKPPQALHPIVVSLGLFLLCLFCFSFSLGQNVSPVLSGGLYERTLKQAVKIR